MTPEAQRIAIAEACGFTCYKLVWKFPFGCLKPCRLGDGDFVLKDGERYDVYGDFPDYLNDLNAMHEAEKVLTDAQKEVYADALDRRGLREDDDSIDWWSVYLVAHATAAQRAEAFLRTLGKWDDTK